MKDITTNERKEQILALRQRTILAENHRETWSKEDKTTLEQLFREGIGVTDMALYFHRSELAVANQISKLYPKVRRPNQGKEDCKCPQCLHYRTCSELCPEQKANSKQSK